MSLETIVDNYGSNRVITSRDDTLSSLVGAVGSIPAKAIMFSPKMGTYPSKEVRDHVKSYITERQLEDTTVRLGHTRVLEDTIRLFTDDRLKDLSVLGRIVLGIPTTLIGGTIAKLTRSDNYNPFTKTAHCYSNIKAIAAHEMGHAEDFQRWKNPLTGETKKREFPTLYSMVRSILPVTLYQEGKASQFAHQSLPKKDKWQTHRYLVPGFLSYALSPFAALGFADASHLYLEAKNGIKSKLSGAKDSLVSKKASILESLNLAPNEGLTTSDTNPARFARWATGH